MNHYYFNRGLDVVEELAKQFKTRHWMLPDLICDDVLDVIFKYVNDFSYYRVKDDFSWETQIKGPEPKVLFAITYFGKELWLKSDPPPNTIVIRDSIWMPRPFAHVESYQIWFNSFRKILRGAKGASVVTPYRLRGCPEVPNIYNHPDLYWDEINIRFNNFCELDKFLPEEYRVKYIPEFPTVFPVRLKRRDEVLSKIETPLPGMWKNKYKIANPLYKELTFIPVDSRFKRDDVLKIAEQMVQYDQRIQKSLDK